MPALAWPPRNTVVASLTYIARSAMIGWLAAIDAETSAAASDGIDVVDVDGRSAARRQR